MRLFKTVLMVAFSAAMLAGSAATACAAIACSGKVYWHSHDRYSYPKDSGVVVHKDSWHAGPGITFREHEGRGYWRGDKWATW